VVLHLVDPDSVASTSLDYYLETELAGENLGTVVFLRSDGRLTLLMDSALAQQSLASSVLDADRGLPALIAIQDGMPVQGCKDSHSCRGSEVEPHAVGH
jgi:hypothetical protein